jgi:hypothetical protein
MVEMLTKHTVLVTSAVHTNYGIYDTKQRIQQTLDTVKSAKKYIPGCTVILIDNSTLAVQLDDSKELAELIDSVDYYIDNSDDKDIQHFHNNVTNYDIGKNSMECIGIYKALTYILSDSEIMNIITNSSRIFKLSGRYQVTDKFDIAKFDNEKTADKYVFRTAQPSWIPTADTGVTTLLQTRLWSFTPSLFVDTIHLFQTIIQNMFTTFNAGKYIDVEHSMAKFIPKGKLVELDTVGLHGNIAPNGAEIND